MLSSKQRLELLLAGPIPDIPPHCEMVFQIEKDMSGMDGEGKQGVFWMPTGDTKMDFVVGLYEYPQVLHQEARENCNKAKQIFRD